MTRELPRRAVATGAAGEDLPALAGFAARAEEAFLGAARFVVFAGAPFSPALARAGASFLDCFFIAPFVRAPLIGDSSQARFKKPGRVPVSKLNQVTA
jgi:hypothetical protein